jgi:PAS domain S-box-containing protein
VKDYAIVLLDREGRVAMWNEGAERLHGYTAQEIIGQSRSLLYAEADRALEKPERALGTAREAGFFQEEAQGIHKDGTVFPAEVAITRLSNAAGQLAGYAETIRDRTDRTEGAISARRPRADCGATDGPELSTGEENRRMQEGDRLKGEFLANMSHELRTPLNAVIGFAELMFRGKAGPVSDDHREYLGDILASSQHLLQLINNAVDLAKVESGALAFRPEMVDLERLVGEVRDILRELAAIKHIRVEIEVSPALPRVNLDPGRLKQVLYNYLSNALKFTPEDGRVTLRMTPDAGQTLLIEVEDTGIGIGREDVHRVFLEFPRLDGASGKRYTGTGLGLALTQRIVETQGGSVGVRSEPREGSVFWAKLPMGGADVP